MDVSQPGMTLTELVGQWRKRVYGVGNDDVSFGLREAADELDDFIRHHFGEVIS